MNKRIKKKQNKTTTTKKPKNRKTKQILPGGWHK
jgi:hypothetical protein